MLDFKIDELKCTQCGLCAKECPTLIIDGKNGIPVIKEGKEKNCIKCQHCLAVCPTGALSIFGKIPEESILVDNAVVNSADLMRLMKTRRSVRKFKKEDVSKELIDELLQTVAYAPTGHNKNAVLLSVVDNRADFEKFRVIVYDAIKKVKEEGNLHPALDFIGGFQQMWEDKGVDVIFRDAPHVIIASAPKATASSMADCVIALTYFELLANSHGIGTLWNGFMKMVMDKIAPDLQEKLSIPADHLVGYIMIFGYPTIKYARSIQSEGLNLNRIELN